MQPHVLKINEKYQWLVYGSAENGWIYRKRKLRVQVTPEAKVENLQSNKNFESIIDSPLCSSEGTNHDYT